MIAAAVSPAGSVRAESPRVALLSPYWSFWEHAAPAGLAAERRAHASAAAAVLAGVADVVADETLRSSAEGAAAGRRIAGLRPDALVVLQSMAVPPAYTLAALEQLEGVPLVVCAVRPAASAPDMSHGGITADGATVGVPQLTNVLTRRGRPYELVLWRVDERAADAPLRGAVAAAAAAGRLRRASLARVGRPLDGYDCVDCDVDRLAAATGLRLLDVAPADVGGAYRAAAQPAIQAVEREVREQWDVSAELDASGGFERTVRFAAALAELSDRLAVDGGVMNCHVPEIRLGEEPGIAPCFALGRETSHGRPWTCSGDVPTAVAMLTLKLLGAAALYHEIETLDEATGEALLANTGEHDLGFGDPALRPRLAPNRWFDGCGGCAILSPPPGPATLVGFTEHPGEPSGFRYVVAEGAFSPRRQPETGTPNAAFRFARGDSVADAWAAWVRSGVNHHSAATTGAYGDAVRAVAAHLGVGCVTV